MMRLLEPIPASSPWTASRKWLGYPGVRAHPWKGTECACNEKPELPNIEMRSEQLRKLLPELVPKSPATTGEFLSGMLRWLAILFRKVTACVTFTVPMIVLVTLLSERIRMGWFQQAEWTKGHFAKNANPAARLPINLQVSNILCFFVSVLACLLRGCICLEFPELAWDVEGVHSHWSVPLPVCGSCGQRREWTREPKQPWLLEMQPRIPKSRELSEKGRA